MLDMFFKEFSISLKKFVGNDRDEILHVALGTYLLCMVEIA